METAALEMERRRWTWDCRDVAEVRAKGEPDLRAEGAGGRLEGRVCPFHPEVYLLTKFTGFDVLTGV